jgi:peptidoglycan/xylan/chitin deacetylase (PgdA/CDA1 family)
MTRFQHHVPILGYHRVGEHRADHVPTVSGAAFERQMAFLAAHRYRVLSLEELASTLEENRPAARKTAVITFDDGYEETYRIAWPLLRRFGFPAIVFVTPSEVGLPGFATWEQLIEMARDGMTIGSHTMHHAYLPHVPSDLLVEEVVESKRVVEVRVGRPVQFISYPIGGFTPQAVRLVQQAGYRAACTTNRAFRAFPLDRFALRRIKMTQRDTNPALLWAKLSGYYDAFRRLKEPG